MHSAAAVSKSIFPSKEYYEYTAVRSFFLPLALSVLTPTCLSPLSLLLPKFWQQEDQTLLTCLSQPGEGLAAAAAAQFHAQKTENWLVGLEPLGLISIDAIAQMWAVSSSHLLHYAARFQS